MRILHTVEFYAPSVGGAQEVVRQLSERLAGRGHDVTVATTRLPQRRGLEHNGVTIAEFDVRGNLVRGMEGEIDRYREFVRDGGFDVVMSYAAQQWATDALLPIAGELDAAMVLAPCGFSALENPAYATYFAQLPGWLAAYDRLVVHSPTYQDAAFLHRNGLQQVEVLPNASDEREFVGDPLERRRRFRAEHGIADDEPLLLTVGGHTGQKGHAAAIAVLRALDRPRATLALVGNRPLGRGCSISCHARAVAAGVGSARRKRVALLDPPRAAVVDAYFAADVFVFASQVECSPLVLFEAAAAGLPFVTVPVGNSAEIAAWTGAGEAVPASRRDGLVIADASALARAVDALLDNPDRRAALAAAGRAAGRERYAWDVIAQRYEQVYADAIG
jgi:glycosyltransferase involved in cell wall biosynthesis